MRRFRGRHAEVHFVAAPARLEVFLDDCGDGFDWQAPDGSVSVWDDEQPIHFAVLEQGVWTELVPREVHPLSGRVGFNRCLAGMTVRATGTFRPTALAGVADTWTLILQSETSDDSTLLQQDDNHRSRTSVGEGSVVLEGFQAAPGAHLNGDLMLVRLPSGQGALRGVGSVASIIGPQVRIRFDEGRVLYGP